jgi:conjugative transfer signal peptidase TraF
MVFPLKNFLPLFFSLVFIGILAFTINLVEKSGYHLVYSVTKSVPRGLYLIVPIKKIARYDIVEFKPPQAALNFIRENRLIPQNGTIMKYVFAIPNDNVCIYNQEIFINNKKAGHVYKFYAPNKLLPQTKICGKLQENQYLLLSAKSKRSFDGRYFGIVSSREILGHAIPIIKIE